MNTIEEKVIDEIKNIPISNELEYINALISSLLKLFQNISILSKELNGKSELTKKISELYDIKYKIISCQQILKDK